MVYEPYKDSLNICRRTYSSSELLSQPFQMSNTINTSDLVLDELKVTDANL